jgi:hypothetical protein
MNRTIQSTVPLLHQNLLSDRKNFDYSALDPISKDVIQFQANEIKRLLCRTSQDVVDIGKALILVKKQLKHGELQCWLKAEFDWSIRTASRFMQVAKQFKSANLADLNIASSALYLLAEPATSDITREKVLKLAERGENITYSVAKDIINNCKKEKMATISSPENLATTLKTEDVEKFSNLKVFADVQSKETTDVSITHEANKYNNPAGHADEGSGHKFREKVKQNQLVLQVGYQICISDISQESYKYFGEITDVKKSSNAEFEVLVKVVSMPSC